MLRANEQRGDRLVLDLYDKVDKEAAPTVKKSVENSSRRDIVIAIDAGHGGKTRAPAGPVACVKKDVVLGIAKRLARLVEREPGFKPFMVRSGDYYLHLRKRMRPARPGPGRPVRIYSRRRVHFTQGQGHKRLRPLPARRIEHVREAPGPAGERRRPGRRRQSQ